MELADWWTEFQKVNVVERNGMDPSKLDGSGSPRRRRRRKPRKAPADGGAQ